MARNSQDHGLRYLIISIKTPDLLRGFEAIHYWHANVRQNQTIDMRPTHVGFLYFVESFQAIVRPVNNTRQIFDLKTIQGQLHAQNIVRLVIDDEDSFRSGRSMVHLPSDLLYWL